MLTVVVPKGKSFDSRNNVFYTVDKDTIIRLEHSLISLQKWEARWQKPFLSTKDKTIEQTIDYIRCMCITPNVPDDVFYCIPKSEMDRITEYINNPMTATWFRESAQSQSTGRRKKEIVTAEIIYYWMISYNIPSEYRKWNLNQLLTLIRVLNIKNDTSPKKKRSRSAILNDYKSINEENKKKFGTKG